MSEQILNATTFWELLERRTALSGDRLFLVDDAGRRLTYTEFRDKAERVAAGLHGLGIAEALRSPGSCPLGSKQSS